MLVPVFGNTVFATSMVAGVFMAGLALGGFWGGQRIERVADQRRALLTYAMLEAGVGFFALSSSHLNEVVDAVHQHLTVLAAGQPYMVDLVRLAFFFILLLPPTFLMGAAFPAIGAAFLENPRRTGRDTALIYGINTLGGMAGVLAAGFFLICQLGGRASLLMAGGLSLALAVIAWGAARRQPEGPPACPSSSCQVCGSAAVAVSAAPGAYLVFMGTAVAGFCALAYEVIWTRLLVLVLQNSAYAFALILAGFLAGIGLGSLLAAPLLQRKRSPLPVFGIVQVLTGLACVVVPYGFSLPDRPGDLPYLSFLLTRPLFLVMVPMVLSGALVPLAAAVLRAAGARPGPTLGGVYAVNGMGSVVGALLAGFVLIPVLGCRQSILLLFSLQVIAGAAIFSLSIRHAAVRAIVGGLTAVLLAAAVVGMPTDIVRQRYTAAAPTEQTLFHREGRTATTTITRNPAGNLILYLNGIPEVINDLPAMRTFRLMALLPYVLHPDPDDALLITFGAGISAGLAVNLFQRVDCVELNETCKDIARYFHRENRDVLVASNLALHLDDGRSFLRHTDRDYAAIISDATHPHSYDSWILFTREFYRLCARRLDDHGVFCQWLPLHGLAPAQFRTILNTVHHVFPETTVWTVDGAYCLILAGKKPLRLDPQRFTHVLNRGDLRPFLNPVGLGNPYAVLNAFVVGPRGLRSLLSDEVLINTDDRPYNQFFPMATTGFGRLRWPRENLHQLMQYKEDARTILDGQ